MTPLSAPAGHLISTILRHDTKVTSYKIALLRAINDVVLAFPDLDSAQHSIALPLRVLADAWTAYYWPFADPTLPIMQGPRVIRHGQRGADLSFRPALVQLRQAWEAVVGTTRPADGFFLVSDLRIARKRREYPPLLLAAYDCANTAIQTALQQPIRYAGPKGEQWAVFRKPALVTTIQPPVTGVPDTRLDDVCLVLPPALSATFREVSLWVEALCIHEWCLFTERVEQAPSTTADRGMVYWLLTDRPDNRRPLHWERNQIDLVLLEGQSFRCPWTERPIIQPGAYDLDHLIPVSAYPINELWNVVPADTRFNQQTKRDRIPSTERLQRAQEHLVLAYTKYAAAPALATVLRDDVAVRFVSTREGHLDPQAVARAAVHYIDQVATLRNLTRF